MATREERFFEIATNEISDDKRVTAIWGKAFSLAIGDTQKAQALYIKLRVDQLERDYQQTIAELIQLASNEIKNGNYFVCPYCEARTTARRKELFQLTSNAPKYRYHCSTCNQELQVSGGSNQVVVLKPASTLAEYSADGSASTEKRNNPMALTGFILGISSVPLYFIGMLPILGVVFSGIGLGTFKPDRQKNKWMAGVGLALSIVFTLVYIAERQT